MKFVVSSTCSALFRLSRLIFSDEHATVSNHTRRIRLPRIPLQSMPHSYQCPNAWCLYPFTKKSHLKRHLASTKCRDREHFQFICPECPSHHSTLELMKAHARKIHGLFKKDINECDRGSPRYCFFNFNSHCMPLLSIVPSFQYLRNRNLPVFL